MLELELGDESYIVCQAQFLLRAAFGFERSKILPTNGKFDAVTEKAVKLFQRRHKLVVTGKCDRTTWLALHKATGRRE